MPAPSDLIHETSTTTGTGNFTLTNVNGKRSFNTGFGTGGTDLFDYFISSRDAAEWERGTGHLSASSTLVRDTVIASSNADAAVNFSAGTKDVTNDIPAAKQVTTDTAQTLSSKTLISPALGTPASGTLANCTGLPVAGITSSTSTPLGVGSLELGHASDTTLSRSAAGRLAVEGKNALLIGQTDTLTSGYAATPFSAGTKSSGTYTPAESDGNFQYATNGGAHTFAPPTNNCTLVILYANNGSAGTITTSGFTKVTGDAFTTTNGHEFMCYVTKHNNGSAFSHLHVTALQ